MLPSIVRTPAAPRRARLCLAALILAAPLAACGNIDRVVVGSTTPDDFRQRHPIVLSKAPEVLDVFTIRPGAKLDHRALGDLRAFAESYRRRGHGAITVMTPRGAGLDVEGSATLAAVQRALYEAGLRGDIRVGSYAAAPPPAVSPVRLSYYALQANVATRCGEWPADLASGSSTKTWENRPYYNLGCAYQQNMAAQIDDPRDLVRPRAEDPADVQMRTRGIDFIRRGEDPSTTWRNRMTSIGNVETE